MTVSTYKQQRWSLTDLFPAFDSPEVEDAKHRLEKQLQAFEAFRPDLHEEMGAEAFLSMVIAYDQVARLLSRLGAFGSLAFAEDTQDQEAQIFKAQTQQLAAQTENRILFFKLWWKSLDEGPAERLMAAAGDYRYWLEALLLEKPYTLSEPEEKVINLKDVNGTQALVTLYQSITNRYTFQVKIDEEVKELTREELRVYVHSPNPDHRAAAYQEMHRVYAIDAPILGQIYQYISRDWRSESLDLRGYKTPIAVRNLANDVPDEVVDTLLSVCQENAALFRRFFALKARWLGVDRLRRYDIYAPVVKTEKTYGFGQAVDMVLESFRTFDPRIADLARRVFDGNHFDSEVRKGKRSGAFCATVEPDLTPWVLQSYNGRLDDVTTMAHELGHAVHAMLADHHAALTQHASLPLAETASTFGEMLLVDCLLAEDPDPALQRDLLYRQMDDAYKTIMRQAYFALFERTAHDLIHQGGSVDDLSETYLANLQDQFGDSLDLSDDFRFEWVEVPHFYFAPFYVYAYAFGQLLVLSLYRQYKEEGELFKPRYIEILAAGGSDSPARILEGAGIDTHTASFWQGGFDVLKASLDRLEAIEIPM